MGSFGAPVPSPWNDCGSPLRIMWNLPSPGRLSLEKGSAGVLGVGWGSVPSDTHPCAAEPLRPHDAAWPPVALAPLPSFFFFF